MVHLQRELYCVKGSKRMFLIPQFFHTRVIWEFALK